MTKIRKIRSSYSELEQAVKNRINYWKRIKDLQEAHETKVKNILFRNNILRAQERANYQNEYDRLRSEIAHTVVPQQSINNIKDRMKQLEKLQIV